MVQQEEVPPMMTLKIGSNKNRGAYIVRRTSLKEKIKRRTTYPASRTPHHAFTLIELLAVIAIIGLLVMMGITTFAKFGSNVRLKSAADQVASMLRLAKHLAVTKNATVQAAVYPRGASPTNKVILTIGGTQVEKPWVASPLVEITDIGGASSSSVTNITFTPYGTTTNTSIHMIQKGTLISGAPYSPTGAYTSASKAERVKCYTITTDANTARTQVYAYGKNQPWNGNDLNLSPS